MARVSIMHPCFSWHTVPSPAIQHARLLKTPHPPRIRRLVARPIRVLLGYFHRLLFVVSRWYSRLYDVPFSGQIAQLPFGLLLKNSDGTHLEEVVAMRQARDAGLPVPLVISYGEHPEAPHAPVSILMTRMPGQELFTALWEWFLPEERQTFIDQLRSFLETIRSWDFPQDEINGRRTSPVQICSPLGTPLRSARVPLHQVGPCRDEEEFDEYILSPHHAHKDAAFYDELMAEVATFQARPRHAIVFTHGDLAFHNILVMPDGRISAMIDWESAGWYPSYWEFTTSWALFKPDFWWHDVLMAVGGEPFYPERPGDLARRKLGTDAGTFGW